MERLLIIGTGLIGASTGLALRSAGYNGRIDGWDTSEAERRTALHLKAVNSVAGSHEQAIELARRADVVLLAVPVMGILDWMQMLAPELRAGQLVTDVGSTKGAITAMAAQLFPGDGARFLPGHPMAGKESGGAARAEAGLFDAAVWLFTSTAPTASESEEEWKDWVRHIGARTMNMEAAKHDRLCAWVSHLPQMLSTALAALLEDEFGDAPEIAAIGARALRETTRLGASPYSMWRDVAMTNTDAVADTLLALELRLSHVRENLRTPELREQFALANRFRSRRS